MRWDKEKDRNGQSPTSNFEINTNDIYGEKKGTTVCQFPSDGIIYTFIMSLSILSVSKIVTDGHVCLTEVESSYPFPWLLHF